MDMTAFSVIIPEHSTAVTFTWYAAVHVRAERAKFLNALVPKALKVGFWLALCLIGVVSLMAIVAAHDSITNLVALLPWLVLLVFWFALLRWLNPWLSARSWAKRHPEGHRDVTYRFAADGMEAESHAGSSVTRWYVIKRVIETDEFLLLYLTWQCAIYLPKRALSPEQYAAIRLRMEQVLSAEILRFKAQPAF
jgi:hypothetical protein